MFDYENIGKKIKTLAKWIFIIESIVAVITGFVFLIQEEIESAWWAPFVIIFGPILAWISSWILYAYGQIVDDVHTTCSKDVEASEDPSKPKVAKANRTDITEPPNYSIPQKQCPQCGDRHDFDYPKCPKCKYIYN